MFEQYFPVLLTLAFAVLTAAGIIVVDRFVGAHKPSAAKNSPYECGVPPVGPPRQRFHIRFFIIALLFLLFDVEALFLFAWASVFRKFIAEGQGLLVFIEMAVFLGVLVAGLVYAWAKGALEWE